MAATGGSCSVNVLTTTVTLHHPTRRRQPFRRVVVPSHGWLRPASEGACRHGSEMSGGNGKAEPENCVVRLDETKRYFVLRRPEETMNDGAPILTIAKPQAEKTFKEMCDKYRCGVRSLDHIYCYGCEGESHGICPDHPLIFVIDRPVQMEADAASTLPTFLRLSESIVPNAGVGVFTKMFLPAGSAFGPYGGFMIYGDDAKAIHDYSWEIEVRKNETEITVDASDPKRSNFLRWINCARYKEEQNMICIQYHERMYYIVSKPIYPGQELLVWYGESYADRLGVENVKRCTDVYAPPKAKRDPKAIMATWSTEEGTLM